MTKILIFLLVIAFPVFFPNQVSAHAFGQLYNLPVPFWMYLYGGGAAIVGSFFIIGYFYNKTSTSFKYPSMDLSQKAFIKNFTNRWFLNFLKSISLFLFFLTLISGFVGIDNSRLNFNMTFFWVIFLLVFTYFTAIFGNIWSIINPWKTLVSLFEEIFGKNLNGIFQPPESFGYFPAFIFYVFFIWLELFGQTSPFILSTILLSYTLLTLVGVFLLGKKVWFEKCEFFSVFFRLIGKISIIEYREGKLYLRPPLVGLLKSKAEHFSLVVFIIFMLSSTAFDGVKSTLLGVNVLSFLQSFTGFFFGQDSNLTVQTAGLIAVLLSPLLFLSLFLLTLWLAKVISGGRNSIKELTLDFAFSLIPIAFVYNVAHYWTLIFTEGPSILRLISDPFGFKWDLFKTRTLGLNTIIINANFGWHTQVGLILVGHIAAVYLAHIVALKVFPSHKKALVSQLPMLFLMIAYTMIGLWILAQPIVSEASRVR